MVRPLANITREDLEPLWSRKDIKTETIAARLGVTRAGLSYHALIKLGLPSRQGNRAPVKKGSDEEFTEMWNAGVAVKEMARHFGYACHRGVVQRRADLRLPPRTRRSGTGKHAGWAETISLAEFLERKRPDAEAALAHLMAASAQQARARAR